MILEELKQGSIHFSNDGNGNEHITRRPPSSKDLRAARTIEELAAKFEGLLRAYQTLETEYTYTKTEYDKLRNLQESKADEEQPGVRTVPGSTEEPGSATKAGQTHEAVGPEREGYSEAI